MSEWKIIKKGSELELSGNVSPNVASLEIRIWSSRNDRISRYGDASAHRPPGAPAFTPSPGGRQLWFPVVDLQLDSLEAVIVWNRLPAQPCSINPNFRNSYQGVDNRADQTTVVARAQLDHWENLVYADGEIKEFYLRKIIKNPEQQLIVRFETLSADWQGRIGVYAKGENCLALLDCDQAPKSDRAAPEKSALNRDNLQNALTRVIRYLLGCRITNPQSPYAGGLYLFYDLEAKTYRRPDWIWTWGPAMRLFLEASSLAEIESAFGSGYLQDTALSIAETSLRQQITEPGHPVTGQIFCRCDPKDVFDGVIEYSSPGDSLFLAGWGWSAVYDRTKDHRYLEAALFMAKEHRRILAHDPVVEQDWIFNAQAWKDWTVDEAAFGMQGFAEVYRHTVDEEVREIGRDYMENLLSVFGRDDGLWDRRYSRNDPDRYMHADVSRKIEIEITKLNTRGLAWAMLGLLATHRMYPEGKYLALAEKMAEHLLKWQQKNGCWHFEMAEPETAVGISEKGTAIWSYLLYRLFAHTQDQCYLTSARKALQWCISRQYNGDDPQAQGGVAGISPHSGVVYRQWFPLICTYTMGFFGLALLEELKQT